jgi:hypothetical protein
MVDFDALKNKAGELLNEHGDQVDSVAEKAGEFAKGKFGHVVDKIQDATPEHE